ncbi:MAG: hypothetical protein AAGF45_06095 [Pseudomonadota bacterium]
MATPTFAAAASLSSRRVLGFCSSETDPGIQHPQLTWTHHERDLFDPNVSAYVIADMGLLSDAALALLAGRPVLIVLSRQSDMRHMALLAFERLIVLTPHDAVINRTPWPMPEGCGPHSVDTPSHWLAQQFASGPPQGAAPYKRLSKANLTEAGARAATPPIANVQHFWRDLSHCADLAQTVMPTGRMIACGDASHTSSPFNHFTPTVLFCGAENTDALSGDKLRQSTALVAPFALPRGTPVDDVIAGLATARDEPFQLHTVLVLAELQDVTVGCVYGEFVV